uniref:Snaclec 5 n=2 Tax=Echis TaxID=8699 RepID=SL5_ECHPL
MGRFIFISFGLLVVFLSLSGTEAECLPDWFHYEGHCYRVFDEPKTWADAEKFCSEQANGGHLVSVHSKKEAGLVGVLAYQTLESPIVWMGLSKIWNQCDWTWTNGAKLKYEAWAEESYCIHITSKKKEWKSLPCRNYGHFVCKSPA